MAGRSTFELISRWKKAKPGLEKSRLERELKKRGWKPAKKSDRGFFNV